MAKKKASDPVEPEAEKAKRYSVLIDPDIEPDLKLLALWLKTTAPALVNARIREIVKVELEREKRKRGVSIQSLEEAD